MKKSELRQLIRECINSSGIRETADPREVNVFGYQTKHFDVCPGAQGLYLRIVEENLVDNKDLAIQSAKLHDTLFYMEKVALKGGVKVGPRRYQLRVIDPFDPAVAAGARTGLPAYTREQFLALAQKIATEIMRLAREMGLEQEHNYVSNHGFSHFLAHDHGEKSIPATKSRPKSKIIVGVGEYLYLSGTPGEMTDQLKEQGAKFQKVAFNNMRPRIGFGSTMVEKIS